MTTFMEQELIDALYAISQRKCCELVGGNCHCPEKIANKALRAWGVRQQEHNTGVGWTQEAGEVLWTCVSCRRTSVTTDRYCPDIPGKETNCSAAAVIKRLTDRLQHARHKLSRYESPTVLMETKNDL